MYNLNCKLFESNSFCEFTFKSGDDRKCFKFIHNALNMHENKTLHSSRIILTDSQLSYSDNG